MSENNHTLLGMVKNISGKVQVQDASGEIRELHIGSSVYSDDKLITGSDSNAIIELSDNRKCLIPENTSMTMSLGDALQIAAKNEQSTKEDQKPGSEYAESHDKNPLICSTKYAGDEG